MDLPSADVDVCVSVFLVSTAVFAGGVDFCSWAEGAEGHELVTTSSAIPLCTWVRTIGSAHCPVFVEQTVDALTKKKLVTRWNTLCTREAKAVCASSAACCVLQTSSFVGAVQALIAWLGWAWASAPSIQCALTGGHALVGVVTQPFPVFDCQTDRSFLKTGSVPARHEQQFVDGSWGSFQGPASGHRSVPS